MNSRDLSYLIPSLRDRYYEHTDMCRDIGIEIVCTSTLRPSVVQEALYAQGREELWKVNEKRKKAGLRIIADKENAKMVTWTKNSFHTFGAAYDFMIMYGDTGSFDVKADMNKDNIPDYVSAAKIAEDLGLESGRSFQDFCHVQFRGPMTKGDLVHIRNIKDMEMELIGK